MQDLIQSLTQFDIPSRACVRPNAVKADKVEKLLNDLKINSVTEFGKYFDYKDPFQKFAVLYRDVFIFDMSLEAALQAVKA